jgi:hypothetical protein
MNIVTCLNKIEHYLSTTKDRFFFDGIFCQGKYPKPSWMMFSNDNHQERAGRDLLSRKVNLP